MRWTAQTPEDTEAFGAELARTRPREKGLVVVDLAGDLGAGKTTLARGFLRESGVPGSVRSPTYTLVEAYTVAATTFLHLDLYRLTEPSELENLGLRDWATAGYVWLVEWPERGAGRLPPPDLAVTLTMQDQGHLLEVSARSVAGQSWAARLAAVVKRTPQS